MIFLKLALKSLRNRAGTSLLTAVSIGLSLTLLLTVERAQRTAEEGFTQSISRTDLIVGARSGPLQLILFTVFNLGNPTQNITYKSYEHFKDHPAVGWTIPYSLGDGHHGFRVIGTNQDFFRHYHFRGYQQVELEQGQQLEQLWDVVLGSEVARQLHYKLGAKIVVSHGVTREEGLVHHDDKPFRVTGVLKATGTALDRSLFITLQGMEALHWDFKKVAAPEKLTLKDVPVGDITSFLLGTKSRMETLKLQREINDYSAEPMMAVIPGVVLAELWQGLSYVDGVLRSVSWMVVAIGFMSMLIALVTSLNERRREMAILRAIGASSWQICGLLVFESTVLTLFGILLGICVSSGLSALLGPWIEKEFGFYLSSAWFGPRDLFYIILTLVAGAMVGLLPAWRAHQLALKDGLSVRV